MKTLEMPPRPKAADKETQEQKEYAFHMALKRYQDDFDTRAAKTTEEAERVLEQREAYCEKEILPTVITHIQKVLIPAHYEEILRERQTNPGNLWAFLGELAARGLKADEIGISRADDLLGGIIELYASALIDHELAKYEQKS